MERTGHGLYLLYLWNVQVWSPSLRSSFLFPHLTVFVSGTQGKLSITKCVERTRTGMVVSTFSISSFLISFSALLSLVWSVGLYLLHQNVCLWYLGCTKCVERTGMVSWVSTFSISSFLISFSALDCVCLWYPG